MEPHEHVEQSIPDARDLEVYRLAKVERQSTRVIAQILGVSQTRVRQLIDRAEEFLVAVAPDGKDKQVRGKCVRVAEQLAAERVDFLYGEALEHFRQQGAKGNKGPQYLLAAGRMAVLGARLPVSQLDSLIAFNEGEGDWDGSEVNAGGAPPR